MFVHDSAKLCKRTLTAAMPGHRQTLYKRFRDSYTFLKLQRRRMVAAGNRFVRDEGGTGDAPKSAEGPKNASFAPPEAPFHHPSNLKLTPLVQYRLLSVCNGDER
jgi:hypothetical protein